MTLTEAIDTRISCRAYTDEPLSETLLNKLRDYVTRCARNLACVLSSSAQPMAALGSS